MRSTKKYINTLLDSIKWDLNLKSRKAASHYFYDTLAKNFENKGYSLSYYKDNCIQITNDHFKYFTVPYEYLWMQNSFLTKLNN